MDDETLARFWKHVDRTGDCWLWTGQPTTAGYGRMRVSNEHRFVHRLAYEHFIGPIPEGAIICHTCDVRPCVNPNHLYAGSYASNARDMHDRLRARGGKPRKLAPDQVRSIRHDPRSYITLASIYGVSKSVIAFVKQGRSYRTIHD